MVCSYVFSFHIFNAFFVDNPPFCLKYRYRQVLSEGILPGSFVLTVLANDIDGPEHSKLKYVLSGTKYFNLYHFTNW